MSCSTPDPTLTAKSTVSDSMTDLRSRLQTESEKKQLQLIQELADSGEAGVDILMDFLLERQSSPSSCVDGKAYQVLLAADTEKTQQFLQSHFPQGVLSPNSEQGIDYASLQDLLARQRFQAADQLTLQKMCELSGSTAIQRKWLYFTEVERFPDTDLQTIDHLWQVYSEGKFGFAVQREIWLGVGKNWEKFWPKIGWKSGNNWTRYPQEFTWDLTAPRGHLPLTNQLRGVRVMASLLTHPAWNS